MARWRPRRSDDNLFICNLSLNTQSQTNHLTRFTKAIVWKHHFYLQRPLDCQVIKTSAFSWPICQKHIRESYWSFPSDLFSSFFFPSFLFFPLSWHPITGISFRCQQYVSTNNLHGLCFRSLLFIQRPLSWVYWQCRNLPVMLISLRHLSWVLLWVWIGPWDWIPSEYNIWALLHVYILFFNCGKYWISGNLILYLIYKRKPRRLVRGI